MAIALAGTWYPRHDVALLRALLPELEQVYGAMVVALRPESSGATVALPSHPRLAYLAMPARGWGRYLALQQALTGNPDHVHCVDLDHLLYWVARRPAEWRECISLVQQTDCLIIGRTARAWATCPHAIQQTERVVNLVFSSVLGQDMDFGLGARGYSRRAAQYIVEHSAPLRWGDAEWPVLIRRAGYSIAYRAVDGIDWIPSRPDCDYLLDTETRQALADDYDRDVAHWSARVQIAQEIVHQGLAALRDGRTASG